MNPLHALLSYFLRGYFNIKLPFTPRSSMWVLPFRFPHQNSACISLLPHTCRKHRPLVSLDLITRMVRDYRSESCSFLHPTVIVFPNTLSVTHLAHSWHCHNAKLQRCTYWFCHVRVFPSVSNIWEAALHNSIKFGVNESSKSHVGLRLGSSVWFIVPRWQ